MRAWLDGPRKRPHGEALLSAAEAVLDAPPFAARRHDLQMQAMAVEQFVGLFAGLSVEQRAVGERHWEALGTASGLEGESMLPGARAIGGVTPGSYPRKNFAGRVANRDRGGNVVEFR